MTAQIADYLLAFADDEHLMGQHHTEWIGVAPFLEEDLAFSSIGQDELGHAVLVYELVLGLDGVTPTDEAVDHLAFRRGPGEYRSCALTEYPASDWADALVRHWLYDRVEQERWALVAESSMSALRDVAVRAEREEVFHRRHADALLDALVDAPDARPRLLVALDTLLPMVPSLLTPPPGETAAIAEGVATGSLADLAGPIAEAIGLRFGIATPTLAPGDPAARTTRTADFEPLLARMCEVLDLDPEATW
ncbi:MAG: 1,2-phenylacetyl-CoA epoxidase subunit PaaC [Actinomycetota bacterium]